MSLHLIINLALTCVLLCSVNLSVCDLPLEYSEPRVPSFPNRYPSKPFQPGDIECENLRGLKNVDDDNGKPSTIPPDVCGLCPTGPHDLEQCECINLGGAKLWGNISIYCDASAGWTTVYELEEMFTSVSNYPTTNVYRFEMSGTNVSGALDKATWGPLNFNQIIMNDNKLQAVDNNAFIASKDKLTLLSLKNNGINYFHWGQLEELSLLYTLVLQGNNLSFIPSEVFPMTGITFLDLSRNQIDKIGAYAFDKLHNLRKLNLSHNELQYLGDNWLSMGYNTHKEFNDLQIILSNNKISSISVTAFADAHPVQIDLRNNLLTTVEQDVFLPIIDFNEQHLYVRLEDNPIVCDCNIHWMLWIKEIFGNFVCYDEYGNPTDIHFADLQPSHPFFPWPCNNSTEVLVNKTEIYQYN